MRINNTTYLTAHKVVAIKMNQQVWYMLSTPQMLAAAAPASVVILSDIFDLKSLLEHAATGKIRAPTIQGYCEDRMVCIT